MEFFVYIEKYKYINNAIYREKQLKRWHRQWKINLITKNNPKWNNLSERMLGR
jgi:putative endonuclease